MTFICNFCINNIYRFRFILFIDQLFLIKFSFSIYHITEHMRFLRELKLFSQGNLVVKYSSILFPASVIKFFIAQDGC